MIDKEAAEFYAPSVKELHTAQRNSKGIANLLLLALGLSGAGYSAKSLFEDMYESKLSNEVSPSSDLRKKLRLNRDKVDNEFLYNTVAEQHPFTAEEAAELERLAKAKEKHEKEAMYKQALDVPMTLDIGNTKETPKSDIKQNWLDKLFLNRQTGKFKGKPVNLDLNKVLGNSDKELSKKLHYDPSTLNVSSLWTKYVSNPLAKMGPQSAIPLALVAGGGIVAAPLLAKALVKGIRDKVLPKPKRESKFLDAAKEVYEDAARELQEVGYKKEKDDNKNKKEASVKLAKKKGGPEVSATNIEGNPLFNIANLPTGAVAALLALAAYKGVKGFGKGMDKAKTDLSHKTQFLRGWKAMNKLREYNYNPLTAELEEEPGLKTRTMREKDKRVRELLEDLKDSNDIEYNPIKIQRLTNDYMDLH